MDTKIKPVRKKKPSISGEKQGVKSIQLGQVLVRAGRINKEDLELALKEQNSSKKRIGEILIEKGFLKPEELTHGLNVQSILTSSGISAGLSLGSMVEGRAVPAAGTALSELEGIRAPILSHMAILYQLPYVVLSRDDVKAGYVILKNATRIAIKSNNRNGCMVVFQGLKWPFKEAHAFGFAHDVHILPENASVKQPYRKNTQTIDLSYRFILSDDAKAGKHKWPLSVALQPL